MSRVLPVISRVLATEPGTLAYDLLRSQDDPLVYMAVERFTDRDAYLAHPDHGRAGARLVAALQGGTDGLFVLDFEMPG